MKRKLTFILAMCLLSLGTIAQPPKGQPGEPPKKPTPEEIAKRQADMMKAELGISDKQYKKVYKLVKKDHKYRQEQMENNMGGQPPQAPDMGGQGFGGPGMGGPGGGFGGPGMGGPGMGGGDFQGERPQGPPPSGMPGMGPAESPINAEYIEKQEKKLKKILTSEQYVKWRSAHPMEQLELPAFEMPEM